MKKIPFLFILDYENKKPILFPLKEIDSNHILFNIKGFKNYSEKVIQQPQKIQFNKYPISFEKYKKAFDYVQSQQLYGNSYLINLTFPTKIETNISLSSIFYLSNAPYKLLYGDEFVVFSPESFIKIEEGIIHSYPMKGTIDAALPNAEKQLLNDTKEIAEHATIVDLIRNDISIFATDVTVKRFRYIEAIKTSTKTILQVSSEITGKLDNNYSSKIGDIMYSLLPAGSICGAPKQKTLELIKNAEKIERGYYTGVFGYFDGNKLDSAVMIRYIEKRKDELYYRSGGGITYNSKLENEYQEMIDKVYLPFNIK